MPCRKGFRMCLSHSIYTVPPCLIHTCHAAPMPSPTVIRRLPISDAGGQCETKHRLSWTRKRVVIANYKKDDLLPVGLAVGYFRLPCEHSRRTRHCRSRAGARHGMCELTHGMAGERHAMCESAFTVYRIGPSVRSVSWLKCFCEHY